VVAHDDSPSLKQIGRLPSQHRRLEEHDRTDLADQFVNGIQRGGGCMTPGTAMVVHESLEEPERLRAVADQEVLGLRVMLEHHLVVLTADSGDL